MNLTDEQIVAAAKRIWAASDNSGYKWSEIASEAKVIYMEMARVAAPFLQMPWEMPTEEEVAKALHANGTTEALLQFVQRRNASLIPKPVDPRREKLRSAVNEWRQCEGAYTTSEIVDRILAALDAKE